MKTFLAVTFFSRILTFAFAIGGGPEDDGNDFTKCDAVQPMSDFNSNKFFEKPKHWYVTHSRYGGRLGVCREFYTSKLSNGSISYNYEFNGNGKSEDGINSYTANCTSTTSSEQNGKFSFVCYQKFDWDLKFFEYELLIPCHTDEENEVAEQEVKQEAKEEAVEELVETAEGDEKEYVHEFPLNVTVLSTDYENYALIHRCAEISHENKTISFVDNYVVFNIQEGAELPEEAKTKFKEYNWEKDKFDTRKMCNKKEEIKT